MLVDQMVSSQPLRQRVAVESRHETFVLVRYVARVSVSADGKSMTIAVKDLDAGTTTQFIASKQ